MRNVDRKGGKIDTRWLGPYKITSYLGKGRFRLLNEETGKHLAKVFNSCRLRKYIAKEAEEISTAEQTQDTQNKGICMHI